MAKVYAAWNGPMPTTAAQATVTTNNVIKTMLQISPPSTLDLTIIEWGISFDGSAAATPIKCELVETDVAATVTAYVGADILKWNREAQTVATQVTLGTGNSGYTATVEGSTTATRELDVQLLPPTQPYVKQFPLGREPMCRLSKFLRIRVTAGTAVNAYCYVIWEE